MAKSDAVWGIDIGNCSLKAIQCRPGTEPGTVEALAFDFIEYPKVLTQPDANASELVNDALQEFLSRNEVRGDSIAVSVSGQNGLARFIQLPPVEVKRIPEMVQFEAAQQIPFDLQDVVWDYQRLGGDTEEDGFATDVEIGLFAMRRDTAYRALEPFNTTGIEVDFLQLTPLSLCNFLVFDQLSNLPPATEYDPENPPESVVVLSMGTDSTDLVVTNGFRVWQRSIPIGGSNFTKALTKELKLTFAKAEHLKRNVSVAQDAKTVFQAMRPVFNQFLTEIQRSLDFFTGLDRNAKISKIVALGNGMKLPGLRKYLSQSLGYEVVRCDKFHRLLGPEVVSAPAFKENQLCFGVAYGLALQGLDDALLTMNLIPKEMIRERKIKAKKPWALATAASVLLGLSAGYIGATQSLSTVSEDRFSSAESTAAQTSTFSSGYQTAKTERIAQIANIEDINRNLTSHIEGRIIWTELLKAVTHCLPLEPAPAQGMPERPIEEQERLFVTSVDVQPITEEEAATWYEIITVQKWYEADQREIDRYFFDSGETPPDPTASSTEGEDAGPVLPPPTGEGLWIVQVQGYSYHNSLTAQRNQGAMYVRNTFIEQLKHNETIPLPISVQRQLDGGGVAVQENVSTWDLGIRYPTLLDPRAVTVENYLSPEYIREKERERIERALSGGGGMGGMGDSYSEGPGYDMGGEYMGMEDGGGNMGMEGGGYTGMDEGYSGMGEGGGGYSGMGGADTSTISAEAHAAQQEREDAMIELRRFDFDVQFIWNPTPPSERDRIRIERAEKQRIADEQAALEADAAAAMMEDDSGTPGTGGGTPPVPPVGGGTPPVPPVGGGTPPVPPVGGGTPPVPPVGGGTPPVPPTP